MLPWLNLFLEENVVGDFDYAKKNSGCGQDQEQNWYFRYFAKSFAFQLLTLHWFWRNHHFSPILQNHICLMFSRFWLSLCSAKSKLHCVAHCVPNAALHSVPFNSHVVAGVLCTLNFRKCLVKRWLMCEVGSLRWLDYRPSIFKIL